MYEVPSHFSTADDSHEELDRLRILEHEYDPSTIRHLIDLGRRNDQTRARRHRVPSEVISIPERTMLLALPRCFAVVDPVAQEFERRVVSDLRDFLDCCPFEGSASPRVDGEVQIREAGLDDAITVAGGRDQHRAEHRS